MYVQNVPRAERPNDDAPRDDPRALLIAAILVTSIAAWFGLIAVVLGLVRAIGALRGL